MQMGCVRTTLAILACGLFCNIGSAATIDFETAPLGAVYGQDTGYIPGQVALDWENHDGINMSLTFVRTSTRNGPSPSCRRRSVRAVSR